MRITDRLQAALVAGLLAGDRPRVGPFVVLLDATSDNPFRNYAAPAAPRPPTPTEVDELTALFRAHARRPRLEYVEPAEELTAALVAGGYRVQRRLPLLVLGPYGVHAPSDVPGVVVGAAGEPDLLGAAAVQVAAYHDAEPAEDAAQRLRGGQSRGGGVAVARDVTTGQVVGAALHGPPADGFAEVAAVAVDEAWRRRGIGAAVAAEVTRAAAGSGATPFLQAEGEAEARMYTRIGYRRCGFLALAEVSAEAE